MSAPFLVLIETSITSVVTTTKSSFCFVSWTGLDPLLRSLDSAGKLLESSRADLLVCSIGAFCRVWAVVLAGCSVYQ